LLTDAKRYLSIAHVFHRYAVFVHCVHPTVPMLQQATFGTPMPIPVVRHQLNTQPTQTNGNLWIFCNSKSFIETIFVTMPGHLVIGVAGELRREGLHLKLFSKPVIYFFHFWPFFFCKIIGRMKHHQLKRSIVR